MTHQGNGHFGVTLLNKDGSRIGMESLLANEVGSFNGSKAVRIPREDVYLLQSLFGKVHAALASRLSMSRIIATSMSVSLVCTFRS